MKSKANMRYLFLLIIFPCLSMAQKFNAGEISRFKAQAKNVTIIRDNWGIPHIYGKTDADAVFGLLYAQCEDDFKRVEMNYIEKLGRLSEINGESDIYNDLLIKMLIDSSETLQDYNKAEPWLKKILNAYADGINFYLSENPQVKPFLIHRFQPWYPLLWTDGSIGAISTAGLTAADLKNFYKDDSGSHLSLPVKNENYLTGSNGFAIGPSRTASGNAILYINPHVTLYFRPEVHVVSEQGLNVYGAVTWGQFFVYQGFNEHCGWMHTSSDVDVADLYEEKIIKKGDRYMYKYDGKLLPVKHKKIEVKFISNSTPDVKMRSKTFNAYFTHHGPVMAKRNGRWISLKSYNRSLLSLVQSWQRTRARGFDEFKKVMALKANTSNNTVFADDKGNIAYWHGDFIPVRNKNFNWSKPVDGTTPATEWKGLHNIDDIVHVYNPNNGWLQNCNSTPFTVAGINSPKRESFPVYMAPDGENFRGINAVKVLSKTNQFTLEKVIAAGYDTYLAAFENLIPALVEAFEKNTGEGDTLFHQLSAPVALLKNWDRYCSENSIPTTIAVEWGEKLLPKLTSQDDENEFELNDQVTRTNNFARRATAKDLLTPLQEVINELIRKFGDWKIPWGTINRFQRISGGVYEKHADDQRSLPVGFTSSAWGMLPSYSSHYFPGTTRRYGTDGNSFICAVEFGKRVKAKSLLAGGENGNPLSKHFLDQAEMYTKGQFKDVLFYKEDILKHIERQYHPGK